MTLDPFNWGRHWETGGREVPNANAEVDCLRSVGRVRKANPLTSLLQDLHFTFHRGPPKIPGVLVTQQGSSYTTQASDLVPPLSPSGWVQSTLEVTSLYLLPHHYLPTPGLTHAVQL